MHLSLIHILDRDAGRAVHQQVGEAGRQYDRLLALLIEVRLEIDRVFLDIRQHVVRQLGHAGLGITAVSYTHLADSLWRHPCRPAAVSAVLAVAIGLLTGILSGFGIGGGSLLLLYLTLFEGAGQYQAGGINLLYFLSCAPAALISHRKNGLIEREAVKYCVPAGVVTSVLSALLAARVDTRCV